jgi:hypothetical protein
MGARDYTDADWERVLAFFKEKFTGGAEPDLFVMLFIIGVQELGQGTRRYTKDEKIALMHVGLCSLLAGTEYCIFLGTDSEGWPQFEQKKSLPVVGREELIRRAIVDYFRRQGLLT